MQFDDSTIGQTIQVHGFLYQQEGRWILASEPNLKSCCIGTQSKANEQLVVIGDELPSTQNVVFLEGSILKAKDAYILQNARVIEKSHNYYPFAGLGILVAAVFLVVRMKWK